MIEIITENVEMPSTYQRKYQKVCKVFGGKKEEWHVIDTETNILIFKGKFNYVCLICHNLNKSYYRDLANKSNINPSHG